MSQWLAAGVGGRGVGNKGRHKREMGVKIKDEREEQIIKIKPECDLARPVGEPRNVFN